MKLTDLSPAGGCACKLPPAQLHTLLDLLPNSNGSDPGALVGIGERDDAAVFSLGRADKTVLVSSLDFGTPVADDAAVWGEIAATNAISDIYAMGALPIFALNIVAWPTSIPMSILADVLAGAQRVADRDGFGILGGHTVRGEVPLFGLSVTGVADAAALLQVSAAHAGDILVLTKPIGTGIVIGANKLGLVDDSTLQTAMQTMLQSNGSASSVATAMHLSAATDVSGYGLLGHLRQFADASNVGIRLSASAVPRLSGVAELLDQGLVPNSAEQNLEYARTFSTLDHLSLAVQFLLADPQTSGGLLLAVPPKVVERTQEGLNAAGHLSSRIGYCTADDPGWIRVDE